MLLLAAICAGSAGAPTPVGQPAANSPPRATSPSGEWHTVGDGGGKICTKCTDERKDKRLNGMAFLTGMRKVDGGTVAEYGGGEILDPDTGGIYRSSMTLSPDGRRLTVRGYIVIPLFGRTQEWGRAE